MNRKNIGSTLDSFLREENIYEEVSVTAIKRVVVGQVESAMKEKHLSKSEMARRRRRAGPRSTACSIPRTKRLRSPLCRKRLPWLGVTYGWNWCRAREARALATVARIPYPGK